MKILKVIALLLHYPDSSIAEHTDEIIAVVNNETRLSSATRNTLHDFIKTQQEHDLLDVQAEYVALFDRGRALSLHLFEHVHGESRDRGQAMVQLLTTYREHGFDVSANELPDYVPLFLEFCAQLPEAEARNWLLQVEHLLQTLHCRLQERESPYAVLLLALLEFFKLKTADEQFRHKIQSEQRDDSLQALDQAWAEEPVEFGPKGCAVTNQGQAVPINTSSLQRFTNKGSQL